MQMKPRDIELAEARRKLTTLQSEVDRLQRKLQATERELQEAEENHERFVEQTKYALQDLGDAVTRDHHQRADLRSEGGALHARA